MEQRVNSLETDLEILKRDMSSCQNALHKDIEILKNSKAEVPSWLKNSAVGIILAIFAQTVSTVWWASELSTKQSSIQLQVSKNTSFIDGWPARHRDVMIGLSEIKSDNKHMKELLQSLKEENEEIKRKQFTHFKDINNIYNEN